MEEKSYFLSHLFSLYTLSMPSILSKNQINLLTLLSNEKSISDSFYLSGGTALAEFYLQHRLSEDLIFSLKKSLTLFPFPPF